MSADTRAAKRDFSHRPGARQFWGAVIVGTLFALYSVTAGLINSLWYREIPISLNVAGLIGGMLLAAALGAAIGALTMRSESMASGILIGAVGISVLTGASMLSGLVGGGEVLAFIALLPALAFGLVFCAILRVALGGPLRRAPSVWLAAAVLGVASGLWGRMSEVEVAAIKVVGREIQTMAALPSGATRTFAFGQAPHVAAHIQRPVSYTARTVRTAPTTVEVTATFDDGYTLTCRVIEQVPTCSELGTAELGGPDSDQ